MGVGTSVQAARNRYEAQLARVHLAAGTSTERELAAFLGVSHASATDAGRRAAIPADWLIVIMRAKGVHPEWNLTGNGPCHTSAPEPPDRYETGVVWQERRLKREALSKLSSKDLADELLRRAALWQGESNGSQEEVSA